MRRIVYFNSDENLFPKPTSFGRKRNLWNVSVIPYAQPENGVIKKQMRLIFKTKEEFQAYEEKRNKELYFTEKIMKQIDNPNARKIKFKDVRKLTVGISKKDIMNCH